MWRYTGQYKKIDSMPGVTPYLINKSQLFQRRPDGHIYCSEQDKDPVVAIIAIANSAFVEYNVLHESWSNTIPGSEETDCVKIFRL